MKPVLQAAAILLLAMLAAATTWWTVDPPSPDCDPSQLEPGEICLQSIPQDPSVLWIDARSRSDWEHNGLAGSILWNFEQAEDFKALERDAILKIFNSSQVVIYCADKGCGTSRRLADYISNNFNMQAEVNILHGGWKALEAAGKVAQP